MLDSDIMSAGHMHNMTHSQTSLGKRGSNSYCMMAMLPYMAVISTKFLGKQLSSP